MDKRHGCASDAKKKFKEVRVGLGGAGVAGSAIKNQKGGRWRMETK